MRFLCFILMALPLVPLPAAAEPRVDVATLASGTYTPAPVIGVAEAYAIQKDRVAYTDPDLAVTSSNEIWTVFLSYNGREEHVQCAAVRGSGQPSLPTPVTDGPGTYFPPRIAADGRRHVYVVWPALQDGRYDLYFRAHDGKRWGPIEKISTTDGRHAEPAITAAPGGDVWVAWEAMRDGRTDVLARHRLPDGTWQPIVNVSNHPKTDATPTVAVTPAGTAWVAWMSWRDGSYENANYEIYARQLDPKAASKPVRVSDSPFVDAAPEMIPAGDSLVLAWSESYFPQRLIEPIATVAYDRWSDKTYRISFLREQGWQPPTEVRLTYNNVKAPFVLDQAWPVSPPPTSAGDHRVWLLHGFMPAVNGYDNAWRLRLCSVDGKHISSPVDLDGGLRSAGRRVGRGWAGDQLWLAEAIESNGKLHANAQLNWQANRAPWIVLRRMDPAKLSPFHPHRPRTPKPRRVPTQKVLGARPSERPRPEVTLNGTTWKAYFGNLHIHSDYSRDGRHSDGPPAQNYRTVHDLAGLDFAGLADHAEYLQPVEWRAIRKINNLWNQPGEFVTLHGYEWTSVTYGHKNVFFDDDRSAGDDSVFGAIQMNPDELWRRLGERAAITIPHHPSHAINRPTDWSFRNDAFQRLAEIFQTRGNYEYDGAPLQRTNLHFQFVKGHSIRDALDAGHKIGLIASPDHGGGIGLAGVWATDLTRKAIWEALHTRRTFATTGAQMSLFFTVDGHPQGSEVHHENRPPKLEARIHAMSPAFTLTVVRDGEEVHEQLFEQQDATFSWTDPRFPIGDVYYYLRVTQSDDHIGWTSPVWLSPGG